MEETKQCVEITWVTALWIQVQLHEVAARSSSHTLVNTRSRKSMRRTRSQTRRGRGAVAEDEKLSKTREIKGMGAMFAKKKE
jgi:hypothetical protein